MQSDIVPDVAFEIASELRAWCTRAVNVLLIVAAIGAMPAIALIIAEAVRRPEQWPAALAFLAIYLFVVGLAVFRRLDLRLRAWGLLLLGYAVGALAFARGGLAGDGPLYLLALPVLALILVGLRSGLIMAGLSLLMFAAFAATAHLGWLAQWLVTLDNPLALSDWLSGGATFAMLLVVLMVLQWLSSRFQMRVLQSARQTAAELTQAHGRLEAHSEELDRRAHQFEAIVHVSRDTAALLEPEEMLQRTTGSIKEQFGFGTVAVYLADEPGGEISLRAIAGATPEVGTAQLDAVTRTMRSGTSRIMQSSAEETWPGLGRLVLPLQVRDQVIGALAVQTREYAAFSDEDVAILQMMADQIAIAIENARLFAETQASLRELHALYRQYTMQAWERFAAERPQVVRYTLGTPAAEVWRSCFERARATGEEVTLLEEGDGGDRQHTLAIPVRLRDIPIGVLGFRRPAERGEWQPHELALVEAVAERLGLALENVRLLEETQQRAAWEHLLGEITAEVRTPMDVETILQTAVKELGQVLRAARVSVYLAPGEEQDSKGAGEQGPALSAAAGSGGDEERGRQGDKEIR